MPAKTRNSSTNKPTSTKKATQPASPVQNKLVTPQKTPTSKQNHSGKRKRDPNESDETSPLTSSSKKQKTQEEKRLKTHRNHAPKSFLEKLHRAQTQRMVVVGRKRLGTGSEMREEIDIVGTTGNIYKVTIAQLPECTCPDHRKGNECKHKVYVLYNVLKAPEHLQYQRALLTTELDEIFSNSPPIPSAGEDSENNNGKRKPAEGECPICYMDFEEDKNELVWCKAACGNNMHKSCFDQWAASQRGQAVRCVYCRAEWEMDKGNLEKIKKDGTVNEDGYVNVAGQFGISGARDYSSYYQPWARRQFGYGW